MPRSILELREQHPQYTMDLDNIFIVYEPDEEVAFTLTADKIADHLAAYFSQPKKLYVSWETAKVNSDTGQRGIKIKDIMYDIVVQCLDQEEIDRIQVLEVVPGPWFVFDWDGPPFDPDPPLPINPMPPEPPETEIP